MVNLLNVRKKPNKERPMEKSGTNVGLMMKAMNESLLDALRGIETKLAPLKGLRKAKKEVKVVGRISRRKEISLEVI